jgi:hypothetical protein
LELFPSKVSEPPELTERIELVPVVRFLALTAVVTVTFDALLIFASSVPVGTTPPDQLASMPQSPSMPAVFQFIALRPVDVAKMLRIE